MRVFCVQKVLSILIALFLFSACGEIETMFPLNDSYQIETLVNGVSLDRCSIIYAADKISPSFAVSVENDPDLVGLVVYVQDSLGNVIGQKIRYTLQARAGEDAVPETETKKPEYPVQPEIEPEIKPEIEQKIHDSDSWEEDVFEENETGISEEDVFEESETEVSEVSSEVSEETSPVSMEETVPEYEPVREMHVFSAVEEDTEIEITVASFAQKLPYFFLPKNMETGSYTLVFEALGEKKILSRTQTNIFYLGNAEFNLKDISMYLPSLSDSQLILPETIVMLEVMLNFDKRLDPYVIWYYGKKIVSEGKIRDGAGTILWKTPKQTGFYSLRLEVLPSHLGRNFTGVFREITLPVSPKAAEMGYFFANDSKYTARSPLTEGTAYPEQAQLVQAQLAAAMLSDDVPHDSGETTEEQKLPVMPLPPELLQWYQFDGSLHSSTALSHDEEITPADGESLPRWAAAGQSYGLSTGADNTWLFPPLNFFQKEQDQGGGIFLLHIKPPANGAILNVFFPLKSSETNGVWLDIIKEKNVITLYLSCERSVKMTADLDFTMTQNLIPALIPIMVEFYIRPYRFEAKMSLGENLHNMAVEIPLSGALTGEGSIRLGGGGDRITTISAQPAPDLADSQLEEFLFERAADSAEKSTPVSGNTVWDEFAVLFSSVPLLPEPPVDQQEPENLDEQTESGESSGSPIKAEHTSDDMREDNNLSLAETGTSETL